MNTLSGNVTPQWPLSILKKKKKTNVVRQTILCLRAGRERLKDSMLIYLNNRSTTPPSQDFYQCYSLPWEEPDVAKEIENNYFTFLSNKETELAKSFSAFVCFILFVCLGHATRIVGF